MTEPPVVAAIDMGYGHLRAARPLAEALGVRVVAIDRPPLADAEEEALWRRTRRLYEFTSRVSQVPFAGGPFRAALDAVTRIPHLHPYRDQSRPTAAVRALERFARRGLGRGLVERLRSTGAPLLATFYSPAIVADRAGCAGVHCVVTDSDLNRVWAPLDSAATRIRYFVPSQRALRRLRAYGVPAANVTFSGFPLPERLVGGEDCAALRPNLAARLARLDPDGSFRGPYRAELAAHLRADAIDSPSRPPLVTFAVGGAGAQKGIARRLLRGCRDAIARGRLRLALVAGVRREVAESFRSWIAEAGLEPLGDGAVRVVHAESVDAYLAAFESLMADTDVLWTKPSELVFYGALGIPLVIAPPVGHHERYNRRWALEHGLGLRQGDPRFAAEWLAEWLRDGTLAAAAWSGFLRAPKHGTRRIAAALLQASRTSP